MVSFTGGTTTGHAVMGAAAAITRPVVLELGGNDAAILAPDLELNRALADRLVGAAFDSSGQICMAIKRLYVHRDLMGDLLAAMEERLADQVVGDGLLDDVTMGPVHTASARDRVESFIAEAEAAGAEVRRPARVRGDDVAAGGYFVSPALVVAPPPDSRIVREEQFAAALPVIPYDDVDAAVDAANDTSFGLCASVWSNDEVLAAHVASRLEAGTVFVNTHGISAIDMDAPMGGWKRSGFGVELGTEGMQSYARQRVTVRRPGQGSWGIPT